MTLLREKKEIFKKLAEENNLNKAYLFFGDDNVGKLSFASSLVNFLESGVFEVPEKDKLFLDASFFYPDEKGVIGLDSIRSVRKFLSQTPIKSDFRTVVITDSSALTPQAQSALLKIVEEPPKFSFLVFISHDLNTFMPTMLSRMAKVYFPRLSKLEIKDFLVKEHGIPSDKANLIAEDSFGRIGRALEIAGIKKREEKTANLNSSIEESILSLRKRNKVRFSPIISKLLEKQVLVNQYNLNERLQERSIQRFLI